MDDWQKAGRIAAECREYGAKIAKPGVSFLEIAERIENRIFELGGKPAFPVNLSLGSVAAHFTPLLYDARIYDGVGLLKIDVGAHVNGCVGDTAVTVGADIKLIKAAEDALAAAIKLCTPDIMLWEIGKEINDTIASYGFKSVRNLSGHVIGQYELHTGMSIPNCDNADKRELEEGMIVAIEPFATNGGGMIYEGVQSNIYRLERVKPVRDMTARRIIKFVEEEYKGLPFAMRWVERKFGDVRFAMRLLVKEKILHSYPQLPEMSHGIVSQAEHTVRVGDKPEILTKI